MRRDQLEHAIRTACQIIEQPSVIVVGSQAILGTYNEDDLPVEATMSVEIDIPPSPRPMRRPSVWQTSSKALLASGQHLRSNTGSASMESTSTPPPFPKAGVSG